MIRKLFASENDTTAAVLRVLLGLVIFPHGMQKLLGWFGGYGFSGTIGFFTGSLHIPLVFAFLAIIAESFGAIGLITGLLTRVAAFGVTITITVAAILMHYQNGFFMNWFGNQKGEGVEYHILFAAIGIAVMIKGAGAWSLDRIVAEKLKEERTLRPHGHAVTQIQ